MISPSVVVLDYGSGNIHSAAKALELAGARVSLSSDKAVAEAADGLVVPGVGAFSAVMAALKRRAVSDAHKISVEVKGADVTLRGTVQSWSARELAMHSAWGTAGVRSVVDNIAVAY